MIPSVAACLRSIHVPRRRNPTCVVLLLLSVSTFIALLSISGQLEEIISHALPIIYLAVPHVVSTQVFQHSVPPVFLSPQNVCYTPPFLLILVSSAPSHREQRDAIRQTWGEYFHFSESLTLFVLGVPVYQDERLALAQEAKIHGDIVQANFMDTYRNLTLKTLVGLSWASQWCSGAQYILKADDDVFVNTNLLIQFLRQQIGPLYMGRIHWRVSPDRDPESRHYIPSTIYEDSYFPPYCSGPGYVLSQDAVTRLLKAVRKDSLPSVEDVYVGILAWEAGIAPRHIAKMAGSMTIPHHACCYGKMFTSHEVTPKKMREAWKMRTEAEKKWCPLAVLQCRAFS